MKLMKGDNGTTKEGKPNFPEYLPNGDMFVQIKILDCEWWLDQQFSRTSPPRFLPHKDESIRRRPFAIAIMTSTPPALKM